MAVAPRGWRVAWHVQHFHTGDNIVAGLRLADRFLAHHRGQYHHPAVGRVYPIDENSLWLNLPGLLRPASLQPAFCDHFLGNMLRQQLIGKRSRVNGIGKLVILIRVGN